MDGPPGSQGVIQKKGRKRKNKGNDGNGPSTAPVCGESTLTGAVSTNTAAENPKGSTKLESSVSKANERCSPAPQELRDLENPNVPVTAHNLGSVYSSRLVDGPATAQRGTAGRPSLAVHFNFLPYPRGIVNNSNFCFMNSILQALTFTPPFAQLAVSAVTEARACPTLCALGKWMLQYWKAGLTRLSVPPPKLPFGMPTVTRHASVGAAARGPPTRTVSVDGSAQQDAQEFLQRMLEVVEAELKALEARQRDLCASENGTGKQVARSQPSDEDTDGSRGKPGKGWAVVKGKERLSVREHVDHDGARSALLDSVFGGALESHLKGNSKQKSHVSVVVEHFFSLPIDVGFQMQCSLEEAIERTLTTERIHDEGRDRELKKTLLISRLPNILLLHLRRWAVTAEGELVKLDNHVSFSKSLVLPRSVCADEKLSNGARSYRLLSAVAHRGDATARGHYVTFLANGVANPSAVGAGGAAGPQGPRPYVARDGQQQSSPAKGQGAKSVDGASQQNSRRSVPGAQAVLCNDATVSLCSFSQAQSESVYFLVYQKVT